jgi:hypothetical protein
MRISTIIMGIFGAVGKTLILAAIFGAGWEFLVAGGLMLMVAVALFIGGFIRAGRGPEDLFEENVPAKSPAAVIAELASAPEPEPKTFAYQVIYEAKPEPKKKSKRLARKPVKRRKTTRRK